MPEQPLSLVAGVRVEEAPDEARPDWTVSGAAARAWLADSAYEMRSRLSCCERTAHWTSFLWGSLQIAARGGWWHAGVPTNGQKSDGARFGGQPGGHRRSQEERRDPMI